MVAATVTISSPVAAQSGALTYVSSIAPTAAQQAGANTFRITAAGWLLNSETQAGPNGIANGQSTNKSVAVQFNIHAGANGNVSDPILLSVVDPSPANTGGQWYREFLVTCRSNSSNNGVYVVSAMPQIGANVSVIPNTSVPNVNVAQTNHIGLSVQPVGMPITTGAPSTFVLAPTNNVCMNVETFVAEQLV